MVIVKIVGGLGNQLFQYAFGRALALGKGIEVYFDTEEIKYNYDLREYSLQHFKVKVTNAPHDDIVRLNSIPNKIIHRIYRSTNGTVVSKNKLHYYAQRGTLYDEVPLSFKNKDIYINGYWQSEKYFSNCQSLIRAELSFKNRPDEKNQNLLNHIQTQNAVSLHIRRGDYVSNSSAQKIYHQCTLDYYQTSIDYIAKKIHNPVFYIFSDDIAWARNNIKSEHPLIFVDVNNEASSWEDMRLMSYCKHNIIANSTFSWWGAWLNNNPDKIIIAPQKWFVDNTKSTTDLIPSNWVTL